MSATIAHGHHLDLAIDLALAAGHATLRYYQGAVTFELKADGSPLTLADRAAHAAIVEGLSKHTPGIPILSEESSPSELGGRRSWTRYWLVDPLDGTKEFLKKSGEFTINIALVEKGEPVLGVVHLPVPDVTYFAGRHTGAYVRRGNMPVRPIQTRSLPADEVVVLASRDHAGPELEGILSKI